MDRIRPLVGKHLACAAVYRYESGRPRLVIAGIDEGTSATLVSSCSSAFPIERGAAAQSSIVSPSTPG